MEVRHTLFTCFILVMTTGILGQQSHNSHYGSMPHPCDSNIYCYGKLLHTVQMSKIFKDSKTFVDMSMLKPPRRVLEAFETMMTETNENPSQIRVKEFVEENFNDTGAEFDVWEPSDWNPNPPFLRRVHDSDLATWGSSLNLIWKHLGRKISESVRDHPEKYSQIYLEKPVIVPGGRFREVYYWDSFWTIDGLLLSGMKDTVKGMLENFLKMVQVYGHVPNGGRVYYIRRSQPPYLLPMMKMYIDSTRDWEFLNQNLHLLESEFKFWQEKRSTTVTDKRGKQHQVVQYKTEVRGPRPESYREDYETAENFSTDAEKDKIYVELKSGAESGWDYSSRWFKKASSSATLQDLAVTDIAPVDLNSLMCLNARILSDLYMHSYHPEKAAAYSRISDQFNQTLTELFWDDEYGTWFDIDVKTTEKRKAFYLSNLHPLWSECYGQGGTDKKKTVKKVLKYLKTFKVLAYPGGVPTSLSDSGQQWDFPNAWAPLQYQLVMGLNKARSISSEARDLAYTLAQKWIATNYKAYEQSNVMFEKYDVRVRGVAGSGGEYDVVAGFGWTNGVAIRFLGEFGYKLVSSADHVITGGPVIAFIVVLVQISQYFYFL